MTDEIFDRQYRDGREQLNDGIARAFSKTGRAIAATFQAMHKIQFAAPWASNRRLAGGGCA